MTRWMSSVALAVIVIAVAPVTTAAESEPGSLADVAAGDPMRDLWVARASADDVEIHRFDGVSGAWVGTFDTTFAGCERLHPGPATPGGLWTTGVAPRQSADPATPEGDWCGVWFPWDGGAPSRSWVPVGAGERLAYRAQPFAIGDDLWFVAGPRSSADGPSVSRDPDLYHVRPGADPTVIPGVQTAAPGGPATVWATVEVDDRFELIRIDATSDAMDAPTPLDAALAGVQGGAGHIALLGDETATTVEILDGTSGAPVATLGVPPRDDRLWLRDLDLAANSIFAMSSNILGSSIWAAPIQDGARLEEVFTCDDCLAMPLGAHGDGVWYELRSAKDPVGTPSVVRFDARTLELTTTLDRGLQVPTG